MWLMLQQEEAEDYVIATGVDRTIGDFCRAAFEQVGLDWQEHVVVDPKFFRPAEVNILLGDGTKAKEKLGWEPEISFEEMVQMMVDRDLEVVAEKGA